MMFVVCSWPCPYRFSVLLAFFLLAVQMLPGAGSIRMQADMHDTATKLAKGILGMLGCG